jgi:hypothetical protein
VKYWNGGQHLVTTAGGPSGRQWHAIVCHHDLRRRDAKKATAAMKNVPSIVAWASVPIYFCILNLILFRRGGGSGNDMIGMVLAVFSFSALWN